MSAKVPDMIPIPQLHHDHRTTAVNQLLPKCSKVGGTILGSFGVRLEFGLVLVHVLIILPVFSITDLATTALFSILQN